MLFGASAHFRRSVAAILLAGFSNFAFGATLLMPLFESIALADPTVRFVNLRHYSQIGQNEHSTIEADDDTGLTRIELLVDQDLHRSWNIVGNPTSTSVAFDLVGTGFGKHMLTAKAYDISGNVQTANVVVRIRNNGSQPSPTPTPAPAPSPTPVNQAPVVNAGNDQSVTLPNAAALTGSATDDGFPSPPASLTSTWSKVSGPGTVAFASPTTLATNASFSTPGVYVIRLTAYDGSLSTSDDLTVTVNSSTTAGVLTGSTMASPSSVNLSSEGTTDWVHWGHTSVSGLNRKSGAQQIANFVPIGSGGTQQFTGNSTLFSWTQGTPVASASGVDTGLWVMGTNNGFQISVPADTTTRTLKLYLGVYAARGRLEASLSDSSAPDYVDTSVLNTTDSSNSVYTLAFRANSPGQQLTVKWTLSETYNSWGNVTLQAATLIGGGGGPTPTPVPSPSPTPVPSPTATPTPTPTPLPTATPSPLPSPTPTLGNTITISPNVTHQTIVGWQASGETGINDKIVSGELYRNAVLDASVDLGINRVRIGLTSGLVENSTDYFQAFLNRGVDRTGDNEPQEYGAIRANRRVPVNDNSDPNTINPNGFKWAYINWQMDKVVVPMKAKVQARGEPFFFQISYIHFSTANQLHVDSPAEYGELVLATWNHINERYGFVPDGLEVFLEPDNEAADVAPAELAAMIIAARNRLVSAGYPKPIITAPSTVSGPNARPYYGSLKQSSTIAAQYIDEIGYHRYVDISDVALLELRNASDGKALAMSEYGGATYLELHRDLKFGRVSAWEQYALGYPEADNGFQYFYVTGSAPNFVVRMGERTKFIRQYTKFIRPNAVMLGVTNSSPAFDGLPFRNANGTYAVPIKASQGGTVVVQNLPPGTYGIKYTTIYEYDINLPNQVVTGGGGSVSFTMPTAGVVTVYDINYMSN